MSLFLAVGLAKLAWLGQLPPRPMPRHHFLLLVVAITLVYLPVSGCFRDGTHHNHPLFLSLTTDTHTITMLLQLLQGVQGLSKVAEFCRIPLPENSPPFLWVVPISLSLFPSPSLCFPSSLSPEKSSPQRHLIHRFKNALTNSASTSIFFYHRTDIKKTHALRI